MEFHYIADEQGNVQSVIVPIQLWRETAYLLKSLKMKQRLLEAKERQEGIPFDEAIKKPGI